METQALAAVIGQNIHQYRKKAGMTQGELAERAEVGTTFISRVERGEKLMKLQTLYKIAEALDVSCDALLYERNDSVPLENIRRMLADKPPDFVAGVEDLIRVCISRFAEQST